MSDRRHKSKFISLLLICVVLVAWELKIATADALIDVTARLELDAIESVHYLSFPTIAKIFIWEQGVSKDFPRPLPTLSAAVSIWEPLKWQICEYQSTDINKKNGFTEWNVDILRLRTESFAIGSLFSPFKKFQLAGQVHNRAQWEAFGKTTLKEFVWQTYSYC